MKNVFAFILTASVASIATQAHATPGVPVPTANAANPSPALEFDLEDAERAEFSGGRLAVEIVGSIVVGSAASYATLQAVCGNEICLGGALAALGTNLVATPMSGWGIGRLMGGKGTLSATYWGALIGFGVGAPFAAQGNLGLAIGMIAMPFTGPLMFEMSSGTAASEMKSQLGFVAVPYAAASGNKGATFGFAGAF